MKKTNKLFVLSFLSLFLCACGSTSSVTPDETSTASENTAGNSQAERTSSATETSTSTGESTSLTDTSGNAISGGSAKLSFSNTSVSLTAKYLIDGVTVNITSGDYTYASGSSDGVVFLVINGGTLNITGTASSYVNITKSGTGASNGQVGDDYNFYGINSGIVVAGSSSSATISYANITTSDSGANAVVSTLNANVTVSHSTITTSGSAGSRGLHATYEGVITASDDEITTQGTSCASLATDRGGGTITASDMTLETNGRGSPLVYSTGSISVSDSTGKANSAQMVVVEGGSSATLSGCTFSATGDGNRTGTSDSDSSSHTIDAGGIFIYQSFSGDASEGTDYFTATNCSFSLTTSGIPMIYCTNITAEITLSSNTFTQASSSDYFLMAEATNQWGTTGKNGATVDITATSQDLTSYKAYEGSTSSISVTGSSFSAID